MKLNESQKHLLQLTRRGAQEDGWAPVSALVMTILDTLPEDLVQIEQVGTEGRGRIRLTDRGNAVVDHLEGTPEIMLREKTEHGTLR